MNRQVFFFAVLIGTAVFIYLIGSFLLASFNIAQWTGFWRFIAVFFYFSLVGGILKGPEAVESLKRESRPKALAELETNTK